MARDHWPPSVQRRPGRLKAARTKSRDRLRSRSGMCPPPTPCPGPQSSAAAERPATAQGGRSQRAWGRVEGGSRAGFRVKQGELGAGPGRAVRGARPPPRQRLQTRIMKREASVPHPQLRGAGSAVVSREVTVPLCICWSARNGAENCLLPRKREHRDQTMAGRVEDAARGAVLSVPHLERREAERQRS